MTIRFGRLDGAISDPPLYGDFFTYDGTTTAFLSMELRKNFHSLSVLVKINDKMANLNSIFKYLDVT